MEKTEEKLADISKRYFGTASLYPRDSDAQDFRKVAAWSLQSALAAAFEAGRRSCEDKR